MDQFFKEMSLVFLLFAVVVIWMSILFWLFKKVSNEIKKKFELDGFKVEVASVVLVMFSLSVASFSISRLAAL